MQEHVTHSLLEAITSPAASTYRDVFQHTNNMNFVGLFILVGFLLFMVGTVASIMMAVKDAKRIKTALDAGEDFQKRDAPRMRFLIPVMIVAELATIAAPTIYAAATQQETVSAMQANVKTKYGAGLELPQVGPNAKLMQATSPDRPHQYILTFPDGTAGNYSVRFDKGTSEPFILNSDGSVQDPAPSESPEEDISQE